MPLRHLTLSDPQYVPQYNTLDTNLINTVDSQIEQQGQAAREQRGQFGVLTDTAIEQTQGLPDEFQQDVAGLVDRSRQNIDQAFEERGARFALPAVEKEARNLSQQMRPYQQVAQQARAYQQQIDEIGRDKNVDAHVRRHLKKQVQFDRDPEGRPMFQGRDLEILNNWTNIREEIQDFSDRWKSSDAGMYDMLKESPYGDHVYSAMVEHGRADEFQAAAMIQILNDPDRREQIALSLEAMGIEPTDENMELEVLSMVEPEYRNQLFEKQKHIKRQEQSAQDYNNNYNPNYNPSFKIGTQGNKALTSVENVFKSKEGNKDAQQNLSRQAEEHLGRMKRQNERYQNVELVNVGDKLVFRDKTTNEPFYDHKLSQINTQRQNLQDIESRHSELLNKVIDDVFGDQYKSYEDFLESADIEESRKYLEQGFKQYHIKDWNETDEEFQEKKEQWVEKKLKDRNPEFAKLNEKLKLEFSEKEVEIIPTPVRKQSQEKLNGIWSSVRRSTSLMDKEGNPIESDDEYDKVPENAKLVGYMYTQNGMEFMWQPEKTEDWAGDILRSIPNSSQVRALIQGGDLEAAQASVYNIITEATSPDNPSGTKSLTIGGQEVTIQYNRNDGSVAFHLPYEWVEEAREEQMRLLEEERDSSGTLPEYLFYSSMNEAASALQFIMEKRGD